MTIHSHPSRTRAERQAAAHPLEASIPVQTVVSLKSTAGQVDRHHQLASRKADEDIQHAREAGRLRLEVKAALPHSMSIVWCRENFKVSAQQAQRYMATFQGKPPPPKTLASTSDMMSHFPAQTPADPPEHLVGKSKPDWQPTAGHWHFAVTDSHGTVWVVPDAEDAGVFHISRHYDKDRADIYVGTRRPIEAWLAEDHLRVAYCIHDARLLPWKSRQKPGLSWPFGGPEVAHG